MKDTATSALHKLASRNEAHQAAIVAAGGIELLVQCVRSGSYSAGARGTSASTSIEASSASSARLSASWPSDVRRVGDGDMESAAQQAAQVLVSMISNDHKHRIVATGGIPALVCLLRSNRVVSQYSAAVGLHSLSIVGVELKRLIGAAGPLPRLVQLLLPPSSISASRDREGAITREDVQQAAAEAIHTLSFCCPENQAAIGAAGGVAALMRLVRQPGGSLDLQEAALAALRNLANNDHTILASIAAVGGVDTLQVLWDGGNPRLHEHAAVLLRAVEG